MLIASVLTVLKGFRAGRQQTFWDDYYTIRYQPAIFENPDSLLHYARLAYLEDDPDGLGITGTAAFFYMNDPAAHDTLPLVTPDEGAIMLLRAAQLGSDRALYVIESLHYQHLWHWSLPEQLEE